MYSFSQNFEDVYIRRAFKDVQQGFYIDAGAYDPVVDSVTKMLYDDGWSGINLEPGPNFSTFKERTRDLNLPYALGGADGKTTFYYRSADPGTSSIITNGGDDARSSISSYEVPIVSLASLFSDHVRSRHVHFLKMDIEGAEWDVLSTTDWNLSRPELLIIESTYPYTNERRDGEWIGHLAMFNYHEVYFDGINTYFLREESMSRRSAFFAPVNVLDGVRKYEPVQHGGAVLEIAAAEEKILKRASAAAERQAEISSRMMTDLETRLDERREKLEQSLRSLDRSATDMAARCGLKAEDIDNPDIETPVERVATIVTKLASELHERQTRSRDIDEERRRVAELSIANEELRGRCAALEARLASSRRARLRSVELAISVEQKLRRDSETVLVGERDRARHDAHVAGTSLDRHRMIAMGELLRARLEQQAEHDSTERRRLAADAQASHQYQRVLDRYAQLENELDYLSMAQERTADQRPRTSLFRRTLALLFATATVRQANRLRDRQFFDAAATAYGRAHWLLPQRWDLMVQRANMLKDAGRLSESEMAYGMALIQAPDEHDIFVQLSHLFAAAGRPCRAARASAQACMQGEPVPHAAASALAIRED